MMRRMARDFKTIGVVGLGTMGAGITEVFARNGYTVVGVEVDDDGVARGRQHLEHSTARAVSRGKLSEDEAKALHDRVSFATSCIRGETRGRDFYRRRRLQGRLDRRPPRSGCITVGRRFSELCCDARRTTRRCDGGRRHADRPA